MSDAPVMVIWRKDLLSPEWEAGLCQTYDNENVARAFIFARHKHVAGAYADWLPISMCWHQPEETMPGWRSEVFKPLYAHPRGPVIALMFRRKAP